jgi:hypothetical protein
MERRLDGRERLYLSKGGHLMLIKSTFQPFYRILFSLFYRKLQEGFFCGMVWIMGLNSILLIGRRFVLLGSLEIKSLLTFTRILLGGYRGMLWREAFWQWVMDKKYGSLMGGWCNNVIMGPYRVSL